MLDPPLQIMNEIEDADSTHPIKDKSQIQHNW